MLNALHELCTSVGFMPHGQCYLWTPGLVWLHVIADALIVIAYYSIPLSLAWFVRKRSDVDFRWIYVCFAIFILACGTSHLLEIWNVWHADYWLSGAVKALTAAASLPTAYLLTRLLPVALTLPSPGALQKVNQELAQEVATRKQAEEQLRDLTVQLEQRVAERTAELQAANGELQRHVAERTRTEEQLRARTAFFEAQVDSALDGILVVDSAGRKLLQNRRMNEIWRIPPEIVADPDDARQVRFVASRAANPQQFTEKIALLYSHPTAISRDVIELVDGTVLDRYSAPVGDAQGKHYGRIWAFRDITEQRRLEEQLRQSQKMEAIGQLSGGIAHDFNNLLTAIIGHLGLLRGNPQVTPQIAESLGEISAAANRAAKLTSQLLSFSRRQVISISPLDLNEVVTNLSKMLRRLLGEQVAVQLDFAPEELTFQGDAGMMEQVLVNLAVNARDAMPGGGKLKITTRRETRVPPATDGATTVLPAEYVRLSVADAGTGISPEIRSKIFEPFFTTKGVGKGTGLGLATVFGIVQQHHGWIEVESEVGRGTTFHLYLPSLARPATDPAEVEPAQPAQPARGRGELILLVEDEASVQQIVTQALDRYGYRVLLAANGPEALKIWAGRKAEIALLLTDLIMPEGISGLQLARQLLGEKPQLRVVYTSGYSADIAGKEISLTDGVNYLAKPYELDRLFRTVRIALDRKQSRSPF